jgi:hypothetical protein
MYEITLQYLINLIKYKMRKGILIGCGGAQLVINEAKRMRQDPKSYVLPHLRTFRSRANTIMWLNLGHMIRVQHTWEVWDR